MTALTVWISGPVTELAAKVASPLYVALMVCVPLARERDRERGLIAALDHLERYGRLGHSVDRERDGPVGVPPAVPGETTAVKVTGWPTVDGSSEETSVVVVATKPGG